MTSCPNDLNTSEVNLMLGSYGHYKAGFLPVSGGMRDQACTFVDAMGFISMLVSQAEEVETEKARGK